MENYQASPCVGSGLCCKTGPCPYGTWDAQKKQCSELQIGLQGDGFEIYRCGRYEYIKKQPGNEFVPAFGAGCCMSLFNTNRRNIIKEINKNNENSKKIVFMVLDK